MAMGDQAAIAHDSPGARSTTRPAHLKRLNRMDESDPKNIGLVIYPDDSTSGLGPIVPVASGTKRPRGSDSDANDTRNDPRRHRRVTRPQARCVLETAIGRRGVPPDRREWERS